MVQTKCPFCSKEIKSKKPGPRSAVTLRLKERKNEHIKEEHPSKVNKYEEILDLYENVGYTGGFIQTYREIIQNIKNGENPFKNYIPSIEIVKDYTTKELSNKTDSELKEIGKGY